MNKYWKGKLDFLGKFLLCDFVPGMGFFYIRSLEKRIIWLETEKNINDALNGMEWI